MASASVRALAPGDAVEAATVGREAIRQVNQPRPVTVKTTPAGNPQYIARRGQRRRVLAISDVWRVEDEWWREPISRRHFSSLRA